MTTDAGMAQDPDERFDVVRADGTPTGRTKARAAVHRDGDWHRSVHVWIAGVAADGGGGGFGGTEKAAPWGAFLLFQRRGQGKDTWPGRLDATVGGHLRAGEGVAEALREVEEEVGVTVAAGGLRRWGTRVSVNEAEAGVRDRELQEVLLLRDDRPLVGYRPHPAELAGLVRLPLAPLLAFFSGEGETVAGEAIGPGEATARPVLVRREDFIPSVDRYFYRVAIAAAASLRGARHAAV